MRSKLKNQTDLSKIFSILKEDYREQANEAVSQVNIFYIQLSILNG